MARVAAATVEAQSPLARPGSGKPEGCRLHMEVCRWHCGRMRLLGTGTKIGPAPGRTKSPMGSPTVDHCGVLPSRPWCALVITLLSCACKGREPRSVCQGALVWKEAAESGWSHHAAPGLALEQGPAAHPGFPAQHRSPTVRKAEQGSTAACQHQVGGFVWREPDGLHNPAQGLVRWVLGGWGLPSVCRQVDQAALQLPHSSYACVHAVSRRRQAHTAHYCKARTSRTQIPCPWPLLCRVPDVSRPQQQRGGTAVLQAQRGRPGQSWDGAVLGAWNSTGVMQPAATATAPPLGRASPHPGSPLSFQPGQHFQAAACVRPPTVNTMPPPAK